jgi:1,4-dihydroxy-2-naphthoate octaprenyltransferase
VIITAGIVLLWMYSYKPLQLSYLGGGELLQMLGVGIVLPFMGYYGQAATLKHFPFETLLVILPTQLACAIATSIPDYPSDMLSKKKTVTVLLGKTKARLLIVLLNTVSLCMFYILDTISITNAPWLVWFCFLMMAALVTLVKFTENKTSIFLFVLVSICLTLSITILLSMNYRV